MKTHRFNSRSGVALVTTVIVVAVLAVVAAAFMQSTMLDRMSARSAGNYFRAKLAAEAGLADALALIQRNVANFGYVSGTDIQSGRFRTYVRPRNAVGGVWQFNGQRAYLDSGDSGEMVSLPVSGPDADSGVFVQAPYKVMGDTGSSTSRYAFWVDEAGSKQNLSWWGSTNASRGLLSDIATASLLLPSEDGGAVAPMPAAAVSGLKSSRAYRFFADTLFGQSANLRSVSNSLVTPATLNLLDEGLERRASSYFFTLSSPSSAASPSGRRKLNLQQLAKYLNSGLSTAQGPGQPRANLVGQLLQQNPPEATSWGGGDLSWLASAGKYSASEQRQIVANLVDYLDDDLIPTTDNVDNPTYFGVEMKADSTGRIIGHPFINFVTAGMIFNRQRFTGLVNSTRVICSFGLVFPWSSSGVSAAAYSPEINIAVEGLVLNGIPELGSQAGPYFRTNDLSEQISSRPITSFTPHTGNNWPQAVGLAGTASYATPFYGFTTGNWPTPGPTNMTLQNARYVIKKLRLRYTPTGGTAGGYVQILPTNMVINVVPADLLVGGPGPLSLIVKFSEGGIYATTPNLYLNSDPRAAFLRASWTNLPSMPTFGVSIPEPAGGPLAVNLTNGVGSEWDEAQGLAANFNWYTSTSVTNHLSRFTSTNFQSIGELGYIWTGKPWQTLNMTRTNTSAANADYHLLDYVAGGFPDGGNVYATMPLLVPRSDGAAITESNSLIQDGGFNVLTRKLATASAYLTNAPGIAGDAPAQFAALPAPDLPSLGGALAAMTNLSAVTTTKFGREGIVRAMANGAVTQSRVFTVYSRGEYSSGNSRSQVLLEADIFVDVDPATGAPLLRVLSKKFL